MIRSVDPEEYRHNRRISKQGFLLEIDPLLALYSPGMKFWSCMLPHQPDLYDACLFENSYFDDVPTDFANRIDSVLVDWITQQKSPESCTPLLKEILGDLECFKNTRTVEDVDLADILIRSLQKLSQEGALDEKRRTDICDLFSRARTPSKYHGPGS